MFSKLIFFALIYYMFDPFALIYSLLLNRWVLYEEPNYRGRMYIVERGNYCTHMEWQAENPNIQSIRRVANYF